MARPSRPRTARDPDVPPATIPKDIVSAPTEAVLSEAAELPRCVRSSAIEGDLPRILGEQHYSYRFAEAKFAAAFAAAGIPLPVLRMPEFYADTAALTPGGDPATPWAHLIFRSTEQVRLLKPAFNICCHAWEFEVLRDRTDPGEHPFCNQVRMLSLCDEIWTPCAFTRDVLARHGIERVEVIPAPIAMPATQVSRVEALEMIGAVGVMPLVANSLLLAADRARAAAARARSLMDVVAPRLASAEPSLIYLSILNPEDFRKNLDALLRGFHHFATLFPHALLIVKALTSADRFSLERVIAEIVPNKLAGGSVFDTDNIVFMNRYLDDDEMAALFGLADFYLSASLAEGQNLPLLEAMAHGVVPVTTANTAMADYIDPDNAFVVETRRVAAPCKDLAGWIAGRPFEVDLASARQVHDALARSARVRPAGRRSRAEAAVETVRRRFSHAAVWPRVAARLRHAASRLPAA